MEQLKAVDPSSVQADKKLAEVYYMNNRFDNAAEALSLIHICIKLYIETLLTIYYILPKRATFRRKLDI